MDAATQPAQETIDKFVGVCHGDMKQVQEILGQYPQILNAPSSLRETGIQAAAHVGNRAIAEFLLEKGAPLDICTASMLGRAAEVERMLEEDPAQTEARGAHGIQVMVYAALSGSVEVAEKLLARGAEINVGDGMNTPLHAAAIFGHARVAEWLLAHGARTDAKDYSGKTPLEIAEKYKHEEVAELIRRAAPAIPAA